MNKSSFSLFVLVILSSVCSSATATLLGLQPALPTIDFSSSGTIQFESSTRQFSLTAEPTTLFSASPFIFSNFVNDPQSQIKQISLQFQLEQANNKPLLTSTSPGLMINGGIDLDGNGQLNFSGLLLSAKVMDFGYYHGRDNEPDIFDMQLTEVSGHLAYLYQDMDLALRIVSQSDSNQPSNPFNGQFDADWSSLASGIIGAKPVPVPGALFFFTCGISLLWSIKKASTILF